MTGDEVAERAAATTALELELGRMLRRIRRTTGQRARLVHPDLPSASYLMLTAIRDSGPHRSAVLAEMFAIDKGAVSRQMGRLEELGLVERVEDPDDGRAHQLVLTEAGVERLQRVDLVRRQWYDERLADWSVADINDLAERLNRYNASLD